MIEVMHLDDGPRQIRAGPLAHRLEDIEVADHEVAREPGRLTTLAVPHDLRLEASWRRPADADGLSDAQSPGARS